MRKMTFFVLALLCHFMSLQVAHAQSTTPEYRFIEAMSDLDMAPIQQSTGIFYDRVPGYIPLYAFDGAAIDDSIRGTAPSTLLSYCMITNSSINDQFMKSPSSESI